jgi:hypothetical protein
MAALALIIVAYFKWQAIWAWTDLGQLWAVVIGVLAYMQLIELFTYWTARDAETMRGFQKGDMRTLGQNLIHRASERRNRAACEA